MEKEKLYELSKDVYENKIDISEATKKLASQNKIDGDEACKCLQEYSLMRKGEKLFGILNRDFYEYYLENIKTNLGKEGMKKAFKALKLCLDSAKGKKTHSLAYIYNSFPSDLTKKEKSEIEEEIKSIKDTNKLTSNKLYTVIKFKDGRQRESIDDIPTTAKFIIDALLTLDEDYMCLTYFEINNGA